MKLRRPEKASGSTWVASVVLHIVLGVGLIRVLMMPLPLGTLFRKVRGTPVQVERIGFIRLPTPDPNTPPTPGRSGGDGRPESPASDQPIVAPSAVPTGVAPSTSRATDGNGGSGRVVGAGGATKGIVPSYTDPRIWAPPGPVATAPLSREQRMDSALAVGIQHAKDSMAVVAAQNRAPDWSKTMGGKKYGIDSSGKIWIAGVQIPIPVAVQASPGVYERNQVMSRIRREILEQSQRRLTEDEFRETVKRIRERKDRERERARSGQPSDPRPITQAP